MSGFGAGFERFAVTFQKGDMIFCEYEPGDAFYLIQEGRVRIAKVIADIDKTIDVLQPGEVFGEMAILEGTPRSASAFAEERVKALKFSKENFEILLQGNPQITLKILRLFTKRIYDQRRRFKILTIEDPMARIGDVLLMLCEVNLEDGYMGEKRTLDVTMDDVGQWASIAPDKARETLNHMATQRRILIERDKITINNIHDLQRMVTSKKRGG